MYAVHASRDIAHAKACWNDHRSEVSKSAKNMHKAYIHTRLTHTHTRNYKGAKGLRVKAQELRKTHAYTYTI